MGTSYFPSLRKPDLPLGGQEGRMPSGGGGSSDVCEGMCCVWGWSCGGHHEKILEGGEVGSWARGETVQRVWG